MKFAFLPIGIGAGLLAGQVSKKLFDALWGVVDDEEAPKPKHREIAIGQLVVALIVEGAIARLVRGMADHGLRQAWASATGAWPGEERPEEE